MGRRSARGWESCSSRRLKRGRFRTSQHDIKTIAKRPLWLCGFQIELRNHPLPRLFIWHGLKDWIEGKQGIAWEIHLRNQSRDKGSAKNREVNVGGAPGIVVIQPGISARLDRYETISPIFVRKCASAAGKVWIQRRRMLVLYMYVPPGRVRLPNLDQGVWHPAPIAIQHPPGDDDPFALRFSGMLACQIVVDLRDIVLAVDGPCNLRQSVGQKNQWLGGRTPNCGPIGFV